MEDMELKQYLILRYNSEDLNDLIKLGAGVLAIKERPTRKEERARLLARLLHDPENLRKIWEGMDEISRKALAAAYHNDGEFAEDAFVAQYGGLPKRPKKSQWSYASEPILLDLLL